MKVLVKCVLLVAVVTILTFARSTYLEIREKEKQDLLFNELVNSRDANSKQYEMLRPEQKYELAYERIYDYNPNWVATSLKAILSVQADPRNSKLEFKDEFVYQACVESLSKSTSGFLEVGFKESEVMARYALQILEDDTLAEYHYNVLQKLCTDRYENDHYGEFARFELIKKVANISPISPSRYDNEFSIGYEDREYMRLFCEQTSVRFLRNTAGVKDRGIRYVFTDNKRICAFFVARKLTDCQNGLSANSFTMIMNECLTDPDLKENLRVYLKDPHGEYKRILESLKSNEQSAEIGNNDSNLLKKL